MCWILQFSRYVMSSQKMQLCKLAVMQAFILAWTSVFDNCSPQLDQTCSIKYPTVAFLDSMMSYLL